MAGGDKISWCPHWVVDGFRTGWLEEVNVATLVALAMTNHHLLSGRFLSLAT